VQALGWLPPGAGDDVDEVSLLAGASRSVTIRAVEETRLVVPIREGAARPPLAAGPTAPDRLSRRLVRRQPRRVAATHRGARLERGGPGADPTAQPLARRRLLFGLEGDGLAARG
jgi:hypothetical protein